MRDEINEIENDFQGNGNGLLSVRRTKSKTELFNSFAMFYHIIGRLPYNDRHRITFCSLRRNFPRNSSLKIKSERTFYKISSDKIKRFSICSISNSSFWRKGNSGEELPHRIIWKFDGGGTIVRFSTWIPDLRFMCWN